MATSPSYFVNNPTSGVTYYAPLWAGCIPSSGSWTATVKAWSGTNGSGSLVTRTLTAYNYDYSNGLVRNSFSGGGINTANATSSAGVNGANIMKPAGEYSGAAIGSLEIFCTYTGTAWIPSAPTFAPSVGGPGTSVTLTGSHFTDATGVDFNGTGASFSITNDTTISATVPSGASVGPVHVTSPAGTGTSASNFTPSTLRVDNGASWDTANAVHADNGTAWVSTGVKVWADDGVAWNQLA